MARPLVIFVGNRLYGDDKIAILVGEKLKNRLISLGIDVEIVERMGFALIDYILGREKVVIVDSVKSNKFPIGEVFEIKYIDYDSYTPSSPHSIGLPEALKLLEELDLKKPKRVCIIGIEVKDPYKISESLSKELKEKFNEIVSRVFKEIIRCFEIGDK